MRFSIIPLLLLALPLAEIAAFIVVGQYIGLFPTLALIFITAAAGSLLLRVQGLSVLRKLSTEMDAGRLPARELIHGAMVVVAGLFLLTPGFVTDTLGLLLFIPAVRDLAWNLVKNRISFTAAGSGFVPRGPASGNGPGNSKGPIVDLDEDEYHEDKNRDSPWRDKLEP